MSRRRGIAAAALALLLAGCAATLPAGIDTDVHQLAAYRDAVFQVSSTAYRNAPTEQARDETRLAYGRAAAAWNTVLHRTYLNVVSGADMAYGDARQPPPIAAARAETAALLRTVSGGGTAEETIPAAPSDDAVLRLYGAYDTLDPAQRDLLGRDLLELRWPSE